MSSPPSDDQSSVSRSPAGKVPLSRTGKFLQGMFGKKEQPEPLTAPIGHQASAAKMPAFEQPPQELIQVVPEPTDWGDGEESNWDDDFMDEPVTPAPASPPPPPPTFSAKPVPQAVEETSLEIEHLTPAAPVEVEASFATESHDIDATIPEEMVVTAPLTQTAAMESAVESVPAPPAEIPTISVNIPRPKNIKYKTKSPSSAPETSAPIAPPPDKVEAIELNIKRPTTIKYKTKPEPQPSLIDRILAPGKKLWQKLQAWGDIIPNQLTEHPKKILGILAAVLLSITTSWVVINFWPSSSGMVAVSNPPQPVATPSSPAETLLQAVQSQFSTLASQYPAGLITNLELNQEQQVAIVTLGNLWTSLPDYQKQQVAQSLWQQSRTYQMSQLELRSSNGNLLARSPIVGQDIVILANW